MPLSTAEPPFGSILRQANKLMDQMQKGYYGYCPSETWTPSVNLYENDTAYMVCVDLAGVDKEKIELELLENRLTLRGARAVPTYDEAEAPAGNGSPPAGHHPRKPRVHLMEIDHGPFCREVELPEDVAREKITANYRNGMLWIEIPKAGRARSEE